VRCGWKANNRADFPMECNHIDAISHLWHAVMSGVDKRIGCLVTHSVECFDDLLHDVMATIVQYVRHILYQKRERLQAIDVVEVSKVQICSWIDFEGTWVLGDLAKFGASDACIGLTRRTANYDVEGVRSVVEPEFLR
jgi:hypothetical protein